MRGLRDPADVLYLGRADEHLGPSAAERRKRMRKARRFEILGRGEEEQAIFDDRAAKGEANGLVFRFRWRVVGVGKAVIAVAGH